MEIVEPLSEPPIVEVACGFLFADIAGLDPVAAGAYWSERRVDYPAHQVHPKIEDPAPPGSVEFFTNPLLRTWLTSVRNDFVIQIQSDRFYLNWRKTDAAYPRFSSGDGGLLMRATSEFERFAKFCATHVGVDPLPEQVELTKVDHLVQDEHWHTFAELAAMIPWLEKLAHFSQSGEPGIAVRFNEPRPAGRVTVSLDMVVVPSVLQARRALKLEATSRKRVTRPGSEGVSDAFVEANAEVNDVFGTLVPKSTRTAHFQGQKKGALR